VAVDVHYLSTGGARAAAVLAADTAFTHVLAGRTAAVPWVAPRRPGEFYLRELPPLRAVLAGLSGLGLLVTDGYADLDPSGQPGLGAHVHAESGIPVTGVAKSRFRTATHAVPTQRGSSARPLLVTAAAMPAADAADLIRRMAGRLAARHPRPSRSDRSHQDRPPARLTYTDARNTQNRASVSRADHARGRTQITRTRMRGRSQPGALSPRRTGGLSTYGDRRLSSRHDSPVGLASWPRLVASSLMSGLSPAMAV